MSSSDERWRDLADDIWDDFKGSKFVDITPRDAESIARSVLDSPAMRDLLADVWDEGEDAGYGGAVTGMGSGDNPYRTERDR